VHDRRDDVVEEVRSRIDIVDVISEHVALRRAGRNYVGLCPFHDEDTPSFNVSPDRQMFYCFGCQKGGDVFTFVMEHRGLDFRQALELLAERAGVTLPDRALSPEQRRLQAQRKALLDVMERAARYFENLLLRAPSAEGARQYLHRRGLEAGTVRSFGLGWSEAEWDALGSALRSRGVAPDLLVEAGLVIRKEDGSTYDRFRGRLMFPIRDERGRVIAFGGRTLGDDQPKYLNSPETPLFHKSRVLYALDRARGRMRQRDRAIIVEGYMDAVTAHQSGFEEAVASLGTALSEDQARMLVRHAGRIYIAYDADAAGDRATMRGLEHFARLGRASSVFIVRLPQGHDPDSLIRERGAAAFQALLDRAQPLVDYVFDRALQAHDVLRPEGKAQVVRLVAPWWASLESAVARSDYMRRFAERLGVDEAALRAELARLVGRRRAVTDPVVSGRAAAGRGVAGPGGDGIRNKSREAVGRLRSRGGRSIHPGGVPAVPGHVRAERELVRALLHEPDLVRRVLARVEPGAFTDPRAREAVEVMARLAGASPMGAAAGGNGTPAGEVTAGETSPERKPWGRLVFDNLLTDEAASWVGGLIMAGPPPGDAVALVDDCVQRLERARIERRASELRQLILQRESAGEEVPGSLILEHDELQRKLRGIESERR